MKDAKDLSGFTIAELATLVIALRELCADLANQEDDDESMMAVLWSADALHDEIDAELRTRRP